jgi:dihydropteroate synthase
VSPSEFPTWLADARRRTLIIGVLNVTPDSFSDGGRFQDSEQGAAFGLEMAGEGADWIDVGGESTRPRSAPVSAEEQIRRVIPVVKRIRRDSNILISIDTTSAAVSQAALDSGANIVNDISAGRGDPELLPLAAEKGLGIVLTHMRGTPRTMQDHPYYDDVTAEVSQFLIERRDEAVRRGVDRGRILLDPGLGFGKTVSHNLRLLRDTSVLAGLGHPLVVGPSRKSFIGKITGEEQPDRRVFGTAAATAWLAANGAAAIRVHDVRPMIQVVRMIRAIFSENQAEFLKNHGRLDGLFI